MFTLVRGELVKAGITKAELADRLGKGPDQINHWLATPGNWTLDTLSDLLFGTTGAELPAQVSYPLEKAAKNSRPGKTLASPKKTRARRAGVVLSIPVRASQDHPKQVWAEEPEIISSDVAASGFFPMRTKSEARATFNEAA